MQIYGKNYRYLYYTNSYFYEKKTNKKNEI